MNGVSLSPDIQSVLNQMRTLRAEAEGQLASEIRQDRLTAASTGPAAAEPSENGGFSVMLRSALDGVSALQKESGRLSEAFSRGESRDLVSVMIASQKSSVAFQGLVQTRNHMISAYQEIMKMPI